MKTEGDNLARTMGFFIFADKKLNNKLWNYGNLGERDKGDWIIIMRMKRKKELGWGVAKGKAKVEKMMFFLLLFLPHYNFFTCMYIYMLYVYSFGYCEKILWDDIIYGLLPNYSLEMMRG